METTIEIPALESQIEQQLVQHNITDAVIADLKNRHSGLKLRTPDDRETYLEIKEAAKECAKVRTLAVKCCKLGREDAVKIQKLWVSKEKEVVAKIAEVEDPLDAEIAKFDAEVERKINEEKKRQEEAYMQRTQALTRMGALYSDGCFALGDFSIEGNLVKESSENVWTGELLPRFTEEYQKAEAERIAADMIKSEKEAEMKRQQQELMQQQAELKAQMEEMKRQKEELEKAEKEKTDAANRKMMNERNELQAKRLTKLLPYNPTGADVNMQTLWTLSDEEFDNVFEVKKKAHAIEQERMQREIEERAAQKERERIAEEQRQAELKRRQEEQLKAEELEKSADKVKFADFMNHFTAIKVPEMRSGQYRKKVAIIREKLEEILSLKN